MAVKQQRMPQSPNGKSPARPTQQQPEPQYVADLEIKERIERYRHGIMEAKAEREALMAQLENVEKTIARTEGALLALHGLIAPGQAQPDIEEIAA